MSLIEILFRASSNQDGVQSRGAGWHSRTVSGRGNEQRAQTLARELARGDLARVPGKTPALYVHDGHSVRPVGRLGSRQEAYRAGEARELAERSGGDWLAFWGTAHDAPEMLQVAWRAGVERDFLVASACDCAEAVLRFVPRGEVRPARALRVTLRWLVGAAFSKEVEDAQRCAGDAGDDADNNGDDAGAYAADAVSDAADAITTSDAQVLARVSPSAPDVAILAARNAVRAAVCAAVYSFRGIYVGNIDDSVVAISVGRSLAFLVRVRLPFWRVCLASSNRNSQ